MQIGADITSTARHLRELQRRFPRVRFSRWRRRVPWGLIAGATGFRFAVRLSLGGNADHCRRHSRDRAPLLGPDGALKRLRRICFSCRELSRIRLLDHRLATGAVHSGRAPCLPRCRYYLCVRSARAGGGAGFVLRVPALEHGNNASASPASHAMTPTSDRGCRSNELRRRTSVRGSAETGTGRWCAWCPTCQRRTPVYWTVRLYRDASRSCARIRGGYRLVHSRASATSRHRIGMLRIPHAFVSCAPSYQFRSHPSSSPEPFLISTSTNTNRSFALTTLANAPIAERTPCRDCASLFAACVLMIVSVVCGTTT